jgi:hypothetical protein
MLQTLQDALLQQEDRMDRQERRHAQQLEAVNTEMHRLRFTHACGKSKKRIFLPLAQTVEIVSKNSCRGKSEVRGGKQDLQESS